ncbi:hypothetical protein ACGFY8_26575 [Streptomyces sp. NPDC048232]|uniref:hypothetical protein n=1 Tax=Streptomyces sp. NPDC048232 TaxID=3365520 RepID=UPI00371BB8DA
MLREVRHEELLAVLGEEGVPPVRGSARRLGVGQATARADDEPAFEAEAVDALSAEAAPITNDTSDPATVAAFREAGTEVITV